MKQLNAILLVILMSQDVRCFTGRLGGIYAVNIGDAASTSVYQGLVDYIKSKANPMLIPVTSTDKPLVVDYQVGWLDIQDVNYDKNEIEGIFATSTTWNSSITWNPADFNDKTSVVLSSFMMYHPSLTVINVVGKLQNWHNERITIMANGAAVLRTHYRGKIFCNEELQDSNTCRIRVVSHGSTEDVISLLEPADRFFDLRKIFDRYYFTGSGYNLTSHRYEIVKMQSPEMGMTFEHMDYVFSLEEKETRGDKGQFKFSFEFN